MKASHQTVSCPSCNKDTLLTTWEVYRQKNPTCPWCEASLKSLREDEDVGS